jgi:hypothetical protein
MTMKQGKEVDKRVHALDVPLRGRLQAEEALELVVKGHRTV